MEFLAIAIILIWLAVRAYQDSQRADVIERRFRKLEYEMSRLREERAAAPPISVPVTPAKQPEPKIVVPEPEVLKEPAVPEAPPVEAPRPRAEIPRREPEPAPEPERLFKTPRPAINWEQFMGVKLFAWVGGLALFFGIA